MPRRSISFSSSTSKVRLVSDTISPDRRTNSRGVSEFPGSLHNSRDRLLQFLDGEISQALAASMSKMGIRLLLNETIETVESGEPLNVKLKSGKTAAVDSLLAASGRSGNTAGMNLETIGVTPGPRGQLDVNAHYQTAVPHVYAVGDVIGFPALASTSMEQARVAMVHAFDLKYKSAVAPILPYGIYTIPECSVAGETEESLQKQNIPYVAGRARYEQNPRGQIIGDRDGFLKLLFREEDMRLLGVSVIGEQATELVHIGLMAMITGSDAEIFNRACFNFPTLGDLYRDAATDALRLRAARETPG